MIFIQKLLQLLYQILKYNFNLGSPSGSSNRTLLCEAFDGFSDSSKTTGMYEFTIKEARLSLLGATTGASFHLILARYATQKITDGCENRFLYYFTENRLIPYDLIKKSEKFLPSLQQIFVIIHMIGRIIYSFIDETGNDEAQRYYVTKGGFYLEEGLRVFREKEHSHLQSFYSKTAEIFPRLCVNMQRFIDAMVILFEMKKQGALEFSQKVDTDFVLKAKRYIPLCLNTLKNSNGDIVNYVSLETCQITGNLYDNYMFKTTMAIFNLEHPAIRSTLPTNRFRSMLSEKISNEKRLLQLPFQFFLRSDLKQPRYEDGKKINGPFHHIDANELNDLLDKLVEQKLLIIGNFISRPKAKSACSYMKAPIPVDDNEQQQFQRHLNNYKINIDEYRSLLERANIPSKCTLLPDAIKILTCSYQHRDDCIKYGLLSTGTKDDVLFYPHKKKL